MPVDVGLADAAGLLAAYPGTEDLEYVAGMVAMLKLFGVEAYRAGDVWTLERGDERCEREVDHEA